MGTDRGRQAMAAIRLLATSCASGCTGPSASSPTPVTRGQAAAAAGISRKLAAFHLDKLVARLLEAVTPDPASRRHGLGHAPRPASPRRTR
jgi:hypothetical protein